MKAAVVENSKFTVKEVPKPLLDEYGVGAVVKVHGCGLCGSDIVKLNAVCNTGLDRPSTEGSVLGHEIVGEIIEIKSKLPFNVGDRIVAGHHIPCFNCQYCQNGSYSMCRHFKSTNIIPGGFAEYVYLSEEHLKNTVFQVPAKLTDIEASFTEPLGCCIRAVKRAQIGKNSKNLVIGLGSIGILMGETIKAFGYEVYGCDLIPQRAALSEKFGFDKSFVLNNEQSNRVADISVICDTLKKYAPLGFDTVFLTAGAAQTLDLAVKFVRDGGKIIVFSSVKNDYGFKNNDIYYRELTVMSSYSSSPADLKDALNFIDSGIINIEGLSSVYKLDNINTALNDTLSNKIMKAYIEL